jgi:hypothetical protein
MPGNGNGAKEETIDQTLEEVKKLYPEMTTGPLIGGNLDSGNPGVRLVQNDENIFDMLKIVYLEDDEEVHNFAEALGECGEFLIDEATKKPHPLVLERINWLKYLLSLKCSKKGRFADAYKQTATGVLTNAMTESGWKMLQMPFGGGKEERKENNQPGKRP